MDRASMAATFVFALPIHVRETPVLYLPTEILTGLQPRTDRMVVETLTGPEVAAPWPRSLLAMTDVDPATSTSPVRPAKPAMTQGSRSCPGRGRDLCRRLWHRPWSVVVLVMEADPEGPKPAEQTPSNEAPHLQLGALVRDVKSPVLLAASSLSAQREPPRPPNVTTNGAPACDPTLPRPGLQSHLAPEARHHRPQPWHQPPLSPPLADLSSTSRSALWPRPQASCLHL